MADGKAYYSPAQIERLTGIPMNTLRAWERRYGVPKPDRGTGGHRMYSDSDLQTLLWLQKQLGAGIPIGHAIAGMRASQPEGPSQRPDGIVEELLRAAELLDERRIDKALSDAFAIHPVERVCMDVIVPAMHAIGEGWSAGRYSVTVEHFASSQIQSQLYGLLRVLPAPGQQPLIYVATAGGELHALPALMLTVLLRRAGWRALYFGANLPLTDLTAIVPELRPDIVMLSVTMPNLLPDVLEVLDELKTAKALPRVVLGGHALVGNEDVCREWGHDFFGHDMVTAISQLGRTVALAR